MRLGGKQCSLCGIIAPAGVWRLMFAGSPHVQGFRSLISNWHLPSLRSYSTT